MMRKLAKKPQPATFMNTVKAISHYAHSQPNGRGTLLL
ncbi:hypothetical protein C4J83_3553 [Pseudomonas sp. LBUM920]|nr:hypothetical protein C4J83_3553 [Pseudomonas sp. LBUM920]